MIGIKNFSRSFHCSNAVKGLIKTPVQVHGIEGRYATALFSAATKSNKVDNVEKDMGEIKSILDGSIKFREFLKNPTVKKNAKLEAISLISQNKKLSDPTTNMLLAMNECGRLNKLSAVISSYATLMAARKGEVSCEVITAKPLDGPMMAEVEAALKGFLQKGQTLKYSNKVDPAILGGMKVTIGDKFVDMSMASKIRKYVDVLSAPV